MEKGDKKYVKIRNVNKNFYDLPPKDREILQQSCSGLTFDMKKDDTNKQAERPD